MVFKPNWPLIKGIAMKKSRLTSETVLFFRLALYVSRGKKPENVKISLTNEDSF